MSIEFTKKDLHEIAAVDFPRGNYRGLSRGEAPSPPDALERMIQRAERTPATVVAGINAVDDPDLRARLVHVLRPGERLTQFFARTGLGVAELRTMSPEAIAEFVANSNQSEIPSGAWSPGQRVHRGA